MELQLTGEYSASLISQYTERSSESSIRMCRTLPSERLCKQRFGPGRGSSAQRGPTRSVVNFDALVSNHEGR